MDNAMNVDHSELAKFGAAAARWWDPEGEFRSLHHINPLRLGWIEKHGALAGKRVLDVGCGGGILAEAMARNGADVLGIDLAEQQLVVARLHAEEAGVKLAYEHISAEDIAQREPASFDIVTCMEMLEHVPDPAASVRACASLVKPGGHVFFSTINRSPKSFLFAIVGAEYVMNLLPRGTHEYARFLRPSELTAFARAAGLEEVDLCGVGYNVLTREYRLTRDADVTYLLSTARPR
jgi:2-polyprenyl-6-hydroxyphenyl methylase/3-demethylubiquinone-9 3-methyltransferase